MLGSSQASRPLLLDRRVAGLVPQTLPSQGLLARQLCTSTFSEALQLCKSVSPGARMLAQVQVAHKKASCRLLSQAMMVYTLVELLQAHWESCSWRCSLPSSPSGRARSTSLSERRRRRSLQCPLLSLEKEEQDM